jgi:hypothetical protein
MALGLVKVFYWQEQKRNNDEPKASGISVHQQGTEETDAKFGGAVFLQVLPIRLKVSLQSLLAAVAELPHDRYHFVFDRNATRKLRLNDTRVLHRDSSVNRLV